MHLDSENPDENLTDEHQNVLNPNPNNLDDTPESNDTVNDPEEPEGEDDDMD